MIFFLFDDNIHKYTKSKLVWYVYVTKSKSRGDSVRISTTDVDKKILWTPVNKQKRKEGYNYLWEGKVLSRSRVR